MGTGLYLTGERKEGGEAMAPVPLVGMTGGALLGKDCSFLVAIALKPFLAGSSKCGFLRNTGQRGCLASVAACFAWRDSGEDRTPGSKYETEKPNVAIQASAASCSISMFCDC